MTPSPHGAVRREELVGIVGWPQPTSERLVEAWRELGIHAGMLSPSDASSLLGPHDVAVGRVDVRATLDGVQPGLHVLVELERRGVRVINGVEALMNAQDMLRTARLLATRPSREARALAVTAANLIGADLVGVVVLNGAATAVPVPGGAGSQQVLAVCTRSRASSRRPPRCRSLSACR